MENWLKEQDRRDAKLMADLDKQAHVLSVMNEGLKRMNKALED